MGGSDDGKPKAFQHEYEGIQYDWVFPKEVLERTNDFEFDSKDILVVGYPKTGETLDKK